MEMVTVPGRCHARGPFEKGAEKARAVVFFVGGAECAPVSPCGRLAQAGAPYLRLERAKREDVLRTRDPVRDSSAVPAAHGHISLS